jgi:thiamine biosynthesis lipoprotein
MIAMGSARADAVWLSRALLPSVLSNHEARTAKAYTEAMTKTVTKTGSRFFAFLSVLCAPLSAVADWHEETQAIMGTRVHVEFFVTDDARGPSLLRAVMTEMHRIDHAFSSFKDDSELSKVNREAHKGWVEISDELLGLITKAHEVSELTGGAFDITYASVGRYYDYREGAAPDAETVQRAVQAIDYRYIELDTLNNRVRFQRPEVYIALGGIAKGYAVDRGMQILQRAGIGHASVSAGGDSRILGDRLGKPWTVGIQHPRDADKMSAVLPLVDTAVSTSGDYERFFERDGVRFHHILDPNTGRSATGAWSVTILGPETTLTDALSTSVFVLGPERGLALIDKMPGIDAIIIDPQGQLLFSAELRELQP